jgi:hypothetical protein
VRAELICTLDDAAGSSDCNGQAEPAWTQQGVQYRNLQINAVLSTLNKKYWTKKHATQKLLRRSA